MAVDAPSGLLVAAIVGNGLATGATIDQAVKQLPARHRIGSADYTRYVRAADLTNGLYWYPPLGIGAAVVTLVAVAHHHGDAPPRVGLHRIGNPSPCGFGSHRAARDARPRSSATAAEPSVQ